MTLSPTSQTDYSYIIAGGGMAGLSLAYYFSKSSLAQEKILIIDLEEKLTNDKTWCYWSKQAEEFDQVVEKTWRNLSFYTSQNQRLDLSITPFNYHKISSESWYEFVHGQIANCTNIHYYFDKIQSIRFAGNGSVVSTPNKTFFAEKKVFDSISPTQIELNNPKHIKQHFLGWEIESHFPVFKEESADLFDFRVATSRECEFMYVLPTSSKRALFEYTFFSGKLRDKAFYREKIERYLLAYYGLGVDDYAILGEEYGIIPMRPSSESPQNLNQKIIKIGTSGDFVKSTTGYSFLRTQRLLKKLVLNLENGHFDADIKPLNPFKSWMDKIFLQVLIDQHIAGGSVFESLFRNNSPEKILRFLGEETTLMEDLKLMTSVPTLPFIRATYSLLTNKNQLP